MTTETNRLEQLITLLEETRADHDKFFTSGNNAAGTRLRKTMQEVKTLAQALRVEVQDTKNAE
jgi:hypothetical protein|tara:strand:+ start:19450 stop:19638 length:189 start_codon:yes stop_codon:yes gene_type:complete